MMTTFGDGVVVVVLPAVVRLLGGWMVDGMNEYGKLWLEKHQTIVSIYTKWETITRMWEEDICFLVWFVLWVEVVALG